MKDTQHQRQFICYSIPVSGFHNYMCSFSWSEHVTLKLLAVNFCLRGGGGGLGGAGSAASFPQQTGFSIMGALLSHQIFPLILFFFP